MDKTAPVKLTLQESGTLCHLVMREINICGGPDQVLPWVIELYEKLAKQNDKLMGKK